MPKTYEMNLDQGPFELISSGKKVVEMRLNNKNRDQIVPGDYIIFSIKNSEKTLKVLVKSVSKFKTFEELYAHFDKAKLGYSRSEKADPNDMLKYYKQEDIDKYGVLAIEIKLVK